MFGRSIYVEDNPALRGGSPQAVHEQLWAQGRRRRLQVRGGLAAAGLVAGTWLATLWLGLLAAALVAAADTIYHWRKRFASSVWRKGQRGERRTARILRFTVELRGYRVLHGRKVPEHGDLDHVVVGPTGVTIVENLAVAPETRIAAYQGTLFVDGKPAAKTVAELRERADATAALLHERLGEEVPVETAAVIYGGDLEHGHVRAESVTLLRAHRLPGWLRGRRARYTPERVEAIADAAHHLPISRHATIVR
jgi:Nuclease-related domain